MKNLVMVVRAEVQQPLADMLRGVPAVRGFTFSHVEGHSARSERDPELSARDRVVGYTPHIRVDILLDAADLQPLLDLLAGTESGLTGRCTWWVTPVERHGQF